MNKSELVKSVAAKANLKNGQAEAAVNAFVESIAEAFKLDEKVQISGFGIFELRKKAGREGINPLTKEKSRLRHPRRPRSR